MSPSNIDLHHTKYNFEYNYIHEYNIFLFVASHSFKWICQLPHSPAVGPVPLVTIDTEGSVVEGEADGLTEAGCEAVARVVLKPWELSEAEGIT